MRPIAQHLPCGAIDYICTQTAHQGSREAKGCTGSGGHLIKSNQSNGDLWGKSSSHTSHQRTSVTQTALFEAATLRFVAWPLALEGQAGDTGSRIYTLNLSKVDQYIHRPEGNLSKYPIKVCFSFLLFYRHGQTVCGWCNCKVFKHWQMKTYSTFW